MKKNLGILLLFVLSLQCHNQTYAQHTTRLDSLNRAIQHAPDSTLNNLFDRLDKTLESLEFSQADRYAQASLKEAIVSTKPLARIFALRNLGNVYNRNGRKDQALQYFQQAVDWARQYESTIPAGLAFAQFHFGQFLTQQGLLAEGLRNILDASKIFESQKMLSNVILCHYEACTIQYIAKNFQQCIEEGYQVLDFHAKLMNIKETDDRDFQKMSTYNTIALANTELKQYDMALINYEKAEALSKKLNNEFWTGLINGNKAVVQKNIGNTDQALRSLATDYTTSKKFKVWGSAARSALELSEIYSSQKKFKEAKQFLDSSRVLFNLESDHLLVRRGLAAYWKTAARFKEASGDYRSAFQDLQRHIGLRDSLTSEMEAMNIAKVKATYDLDRKQSEIELLTKDNEIQKERIRSQNTIFIATLMGLILVIILAVSSIYNFRKQKNISILVKQQHDEIEAKNMELEKQGMKLQENNQYIQSLNNQLEQKVAERTLQLERTNKELDIFLYRSSHDMRRPITTLLGLDQVARHVIRDDQVTLLFDKVSETAINMDAMLYKMQMMYELNKTELVLEPVHLNSLIESVAANFKLQFEKNKIAHHNTPLAGLTIFSNTTLLTIIFRNMVENAILFRKTQTGAEPFIDITTKQTDSAVEITITDNGIGIEEKYQNQLYELYFRASQASKGNGLGLYLVKKAVEKLNGSIHMMSDYGVGTTFTVTLPILQ